MKKIGAAFPILLTLFAALILFSGCRGHEETGGGDAVAAALVEDLETLSHPASEDDETDVSGDALDAEREEAYRSASALLEQAEKNNRSADYLSAFESFKPIDGYLDSLAVGIVLHLPGKQARGHTSTAEQANMKHDGSPLAFDLRIFRPCVPCTYCCFYHGN